MWGCIVGGDAFVYVCLGTGIWLVTEGDNCITALGCLDLTEYRVTGWEGMIVSDFFEGVICVAMCCVLFGQSGYVAVGKLGR